MRIILTIKDVDFYEFKEALKSGDIESILNLKTCNKKSNKKLVFGKKV